MEADRPADLPLGWRPRYSAHLGYLFTELAFEQRMAAAAAHGFVAVEYPEPYKMAAADIGAWLERYRLDYVQFAVLGDSARGEKGLAALPGRQADFRDCLDRRLDFAAAIGCKTLHILAGLKPAGVAQEALWACYLDNLGMAADVAGRRGMSVIIEPMSPGAAPNYFLDSPELAAEAIRLLRRDNLGMMIDVFHTANAGLDAAALIRRHGAALAHVHLADYPGRHEPGTGAVDFGAIMAALEGTGYAGLLGCEYEPEAGTEAGLGWLREASR